MGLFDVLRKKAKVKKHPREDDVSEVEDDFVALESELDRYMEDMLAELDQSYEDIETSNRAKTVNFLFRISKVIDTTGRIIDKWSEEEIALATREYNTLSDLISESVELIDLIILLDLDLDTENFIEVNKYKDWLLGDYFVNAKRTYNERKSYGKYDDIDKLMEKLLDSLVNAFKSTADVIPKGNYNVK